METRSHCKHSMFVQQMGHGLAAEVTGLAGLDSGLLLCAFKEPGSRLPRWHLLRGQGWTFSWCLQLGLSWHQPQGKGRVGQGMIPVQCPCAAAAI